MRFRVLGPLEVEASSGAVALGEPKERRLLALLVAHCGEVVSVDSLIDGLWGERPPRSAAKAVQGYVLRLRRAVWDEGPGSPIRTMAPGYLLDVPAEDVDAAQYLHLVDRGQQALARGDCASALALLDEASGLWRGAPYAEFVGADFADREIGRLEAARTAAGIARMEAALGVGESSVLVPGLEQLLVEQPFQERLWVGLILALYRSGQQTEALEAYQRARRVLVDELGVEPGPGLRDVEAAVLAHDPRLDFAGGRTPDAAELSDPVFPLEGREQEMAALRAAWVEAVQGHGRVVVIAGGPGAGKTRLVTEFARELRRVGSSVLSQTHARAPSPAGLVARLAPPVLAVLDEPLTGLAPGSVAGHAVLVVVTLDADAAADHVRTALAECERLDLAPLPPSRAERMVRRLTDEAGVDLDVVSIVRQAAGNPGAIRRLVAQAVEVQAEARRDAAAGVTAAAHQGLLAARRDMASSISGLRRARQIGPPDARPPATGVGPWMGLLPYTRAEQWLFFGRDALVSDLLARMAEVNLVAVVGASGSGKSSVVRAGLLPALADGALPGSALWRQHVLMPGERLPSSDGPTVVVVDQFEEAWTRLDQSRAEYLEQVVQLAQQGQHVVLTLRADYLDRCTESPALAAAISDGSVLVGPLDEAELRAVITLPAAAFGVTTESALVELVVADVRNESAALPLLSTALAAAWGRRQGRVITVDAYRSSGGVQAAVGRLAEEAFAGLRPAGQAAARRLLMRLATSDEMGGIVRRRMHRDEIGGDADLSDALDALVNSRLVTVDGSYLDIAHEALFTQWPRLSGWLADDERGRALRAYLAPLAMEWDHNGRPESDLLRGLRLSAVSDWADHHRDDLSPLEQALLDESVQEARRELLAERRRADHEATQRRRLRRLLVAATALLVTASLLGSLAFVQRQAAQRAERHAVSRQLGSAALVDPSLDRALLTAVAANQLDDSLESRSNLFAALERSPSVIRVLHADGRVLDAVAVSGDGKDIVAGGDLGNVWSWDSRTGRQVAPPLHAAWDGVLSLTTRPGSRSEMWLMGIAAAPDVPAVLGWDAAQADVVVGGSLSGATSLVDSSAWTPDGRWLAGAQRTGPVLIWDVEHPDNAPRVVPGTAGGHRFVVCAGQQDFAVISPAGEVTLWSTAGHQVGRPFAVGPGVTAAVSTRDGRVLGVAQPDGLTTLWSLAPGRSLGTVAAGGAGVSALAMDPRGQRLAVARTDGAIGLVDLASRTTYRELTGHHGSVGQVAFAPDGDTMMSASTDGTVIEWDVSERRGLRQELSGPQPTDDLYWIAVGRQGQIAQVHAHSVRISPVDARSVGAVTISLPEADVTSAAFSADAKTVAISMSSPSVRLFDPATGRPTSGLTLPSGSSAHDLAYSPDGRVLAVAFEIGSGTDKGYLRLYDAASLTRLGPDLPVDGQPNFVLWSPSSRQVAALAIFRGAVTAFDLPSHRLRWVEGVPGSVGAVAWSPDGKTIAVGNEQGNLSFLAATDGALEGSPVPVGPTWLASLDYSADGKLLAASAEDGTTTLLDVATRTVVGRPLPTVNAQIPHSRFTGERRLAVAWRDGSLWSWDLDPRDWRTLACSEAGRDLTAQEWAAFRTGLPFRDPCPTAR